ncbi:hypothetical protein [Niabella hibiscisoli]|uniref:hypothetical protein n=1 Tax=Niabella hibiscisoli TaxID=1825928 RepID=UPI001F10E2CF|nr:hypothetical protein [Niabella hibiscisoli]MCH5716103.1 hypothetical protein [Niabella hibiscisoli]
MANRRLCPPGAVLFYFAVSFLAALQANGGNPKRLLTDFMDNLAHSSWNSEGRDAAKAQLVEYFIAHGYGQQHYTAADIRSLFKEMDAIGQLYPDKGTTKMIKRYTQWRDKHYHYSFKKWYRQLRRSHPKKEEL